MKVAIDTKALSEACARFGVARLRVFGSVLNDHFDPQASDIDFLVDFQAGGRIDSRISSACRMS